MARTSTPRIVVPVILALALSLIPLQRISVGAESQTVVVSVASSGDDARSDDLGRYSATEASALVGAGYQRANVNGYRFAGLAIPPGAVIDAAAFSLVKQGDQWQQFQVALAFEASDDAAPFTSGAAPATRRRTAAAAAVSDNLRRTNGTRYALGSSASLAAALQEVINRPGWQGGNSAALIAYGAATSGYARLSFYTFDGGAARAPRLEVTYHLPGAAATATATATAAATATPKPTATSTPTPTAKPTATNTPTATPPPTATNTPAPQPTATPTPAPTPSASPTATAMPTPTATPTFTPSPTPTPSPSASPVANRSLLLGPGFSDVSPHQLVRTSADLLYAVVPTCDSYPSCPGSTLRVYKADRPGTPAAFAEVDAAHRPAGAGTAAAALDGANRLHVLWVDRAGRALYAIFDTTSDRWGAQEVVDTTGWTTFGQGDEGAALAVDAAGTPHAAWSARGGDGKLQVRYARRLAAGWETPIRADDLALGTNRSAWHPTLAFAPDGALLLAWLEGLFNYTPDGVIRVRERSAAGAWSPSVAIPEAAMTAIDNGPSLLVTPDGVRHLTFLDTGDAVRYWYDAGQGWRGDRQPARQVTHNPSLGPDGAGGVYIYGHGTPQGAIDGHGDNLYRFRLAAGASAWGAFNLYVTGAFDSSISTRWAQFFHHFPARVDILYWADPYPNLLYLGSE